MAPDIQAPPRSESFSVAELVSDARRGRLRIPPFQRGLRWNADDVALLFDSLVRGYPVGALLLWRGGPPVPEGAAHLGPVIIEHPSREDVRWLVDGQQRVVSLTASLTHSAATDPRFDLWFDPDDQQFHPRPRRGPDPQWIEVWRLLDAVDLGEFLLEWGPGTPERRRAVLDAGRRIREYRVPCTVIEADDVTSVKRVFQRLNTQGKSLQADEIFDAWAVPGGTLGELAAGAAQLGWGTIDRETLLGAVLVNEGRDPTQRPTPDDEGALLSRGASRLSAGLVASIAFLRDEAAIPHLRLLPYNFGLQVLPAFFDRHPAPNARTRTLLVRWLWRLMEGARPGDLTLLRASARAMTGTRTEDERVASLLAVVPRVRADWGYVGQRFRSDSGPARIALASLATLRPVDLRTGVPLEVGALFEGPDPIAHLITSGPKSGTASESIANRTLHPPGVDLVPELERWARETGLDAEVLRSHAISPEAAEALLRGDRDWFLELRGATIEHLVGDHFRRFAAYDQEDRPNLRELFAS